MPSPNIWIAASDNDIAAVGKFLAEDPTAVNAQDENGYTPIHAAVSYNHLALLKSLVQTHGGNANVTDGDGDTPLFAAETVDAARCLVEELGADLGHRNDAGLTAAEAIEEDGGFPLVAAYLQDKAGSGSIAGAIPKPPDNVQVQLSTAEESTEPPVDDVLRRKIEELAAREDFGSEEAQRELRALVAGAVRDHVVEPEIGRSVRQRADA